MPNKNRNQRFVLSRQYITLFVGFLFVALFVMSYTQGAVEGLIYTVYEVTVRQIIFALVGITILMFSVLGGVMVFDWNNQYEPEPLDDDRGWALYGVIALVAARILGALFTAIPASAIGLLSGSVALTSAIFEEPIFCGLGLLFYTIGLKVFKNERHARTFSDVMVAVTFAMIHIGVYGLVFASMLYLMVGRVVYNEAFLKTRTILAPTFAHVGHNFLVAFLGI